MGSKDSFAGGGGAIGDDLRNELDDWLASLPGTSFDAFNQPGPPAGETPTSSTPSLSTRSKRVVPTAALFRSAAGGGKSAGRASVTQFPRSTGSRARSAGRGAAAAYAYRTGDVDALRDLGLDYDALRAAENVFDVVHQIVGAVCEEMPDQIDTDEQRFVVAEVAEWVVTADVDGAGPSPAEIAQQTLAVVLTWAYLTTTASELNTKDLSGQERVAFEAEVRAACEELAVHSGLNPTRATADEFTSAVTQGLEYLQSIYGDSND